MAKDVISIFSQHKIFIYLNNNLSAKDQLLNDLL